MAQGVEMGGRLANATVTWATARRRGGGKVGKPKVPQVDIPITGWSDAAKFIPKLTAPFWFPPSSDDPTAPPNSNSNQEAETGEEDDHAK